MILLDRAPLKVQEESVRDPVVGAVIGGTNPRDVIMAAAMNPQHSIVSGLGALPADSVGFPWNGRFIVSSGNLLADFRSNLHAESQGRLQAVRLYEMTDDPGVKDTLSFLIARDTMHQNQWLAAIEELESTGLESTPFLVLFLLSYKKTKLLINFGIIPKERKGLKDDGQKGDRLTGKANLNISLTLNHWDQNRN